VQAYRGFESLLLRQLPGFERFSGHAAPLELAKYGVDLATVLLTALAAKRPKSAPENEFFSAQAYRARLGTLDTKCLYFNDFGRSASSSLTVAIDRPK
jgi:hypothetical protein